MAIKIFGLYDIGEVKVDDIGLKRYINLDARLMIKSHGRNREKFGRAKVNIIERLINVLATPGHRGKKHKIMTRVSGKYTQEVKVILDTFKLIEEKAQENPIQVLVRAVEKASPCDEVTTIEYGGARYPQAVDCAPTRRINLALHNMVHGSQDKSFGKKKKLYEALADEIIAASNGSNESFAITRKVETEKQADSAR